jgi:hypothetical protein
MFVASCSQACLGVSPCFVQASSDIAMKNDLKMTRGEVVKENNACGAGG